MSVQEMIEKLPALTESERGQLREALDRLPGGLDSGSPQSQRRLDEVWQLVRTGWHDTGGRSLAEGIDDALYGPESR